MVNVLNRGLVIRTSERGYYNFEYPSDDVVTLREDTNFRTLPWACRSGLIPILVENSRAVPKSYNRRVLWIDPDDM